MLTTALVLSIVALLVALSARATAGAQARAVEDARAEIRRQAANVADEVQRELANLRALLAALAEGTTLDREQILEGRLWRDLAPAEGLALYRSGEVRVIDVRSPSETQSGVIPGARLLPIDELEARVAEVPRDGKPTLIYCAGGGRSAAACEFLAQRGLTGLHNLSGGIGSWPGPVEKPSTS